MILLLAASNAFGGTFAYRGTLLANGIAAEGPHTMKLVLYPTPVGGLPVTAPVTLPGVQLSDGNFSAEAEFPENVDHFERLWLEVSVDDGSGKFHALPKRELFQPKAAGVCWATSGNAGTDSQLDFLGTTDVQPLAFKVGAQRALLLAPGTPAGVSPNVIGGSSANFVPPGVRGAAIGGGGANQDDPDFPFAGQNNVYSHYSVVSGGSGNYAGDINGSVTGGSFATVSGGLNNKARDVYSSVGGGSSNQATADYTAVSGGSGNAASENGASIGGGTDNSAAGWHSRIGGGANNSAFGSFAVIGGGKDNGTDADYSVVGGGRDNLALGANATVPGGLKNIAAGKGSFAAGSNSTASHDASFVWSDLSSLNGITSTGANQFLVRATGGVGLGVASPENQLHVVEAMSGLANPANHVAQIENSSTIGNPDVLALRVRTTGDPDVGFNFITFFDGDYVSGAGGSDASLGAIQGNGAGGVMLAGPGNDYAEWLQKRDSRETIEAGDVVGVRDGRVSRDTRDAQFVMVASTGAIVAGNDPGERLRSSHALIAFIGQAEVRVRGPVSAGDYLLPSGRNDEFAVGIAAEQLSSSRAAEALGRAWTAKPGEREGRVKAIVGLSRVDASLAHETRMLRQEVDTLHSRFNALLASLGRAKGDAIAAER